jgi:fatty acid desaturase
MADDQLHEDAHRQLGGQPIRFRTRHVLYIVTIVCALLGIPGWLYIAGIVIGPWFLFIVVVGPLLLMQFLFVLLIPPLRHKLLERGSSLNARPRQETNETTPGLDV